MEYVTVLAAALASYVFGAIWYMVLAKPWMAATGISEDQIKTPDGKMKGGPMPFIISLVSAILVAGMMRHIFNLAGITTIDKGFVSGLGLGLFIVAPWIATNYGFAMRSRNLLLIDGGYAVIGCTIMGVILTVL